MTHESSASLISLGLSPQFQDEESSIRWWLAVSLATHAIIIFILTTLRFTPMLEQPLQSYEVSLVNISDIQAPPTKSKARAKASKARRTPRAKPKARPPQPKAKVLPPLPTQTATERLSESFSGAVKSVVIPQERSLPTPPPTESPSPTTQPTEDSNILENIKLPAAAPQFSPPQRLEPKPQVAIPKHDIQPAPVTQEVTEPTPAPPTPSQPNVHQETQKALQAIKAPPEAPTLKPIQPFKAAKRKERLDPNVENLSEALKKKIQSVKVPTPKTKVTKKRRPTRSQQEVPVIPPSNTQATPEAPQLARVAPAQKNLKTPEPKQEKLADSLKQVLDAVKMPNLRTAPNVKASQKKPLTQKSQVPPVPETSSQRESARTKKLKTEIDQQLAKLKIPQVAPIESLKKRLQVQVVTASEPGEGEDSSPASSASRNSPGRNRYLALIEAKIEEKWVAPRVSIAENHPQVILKFRILRTGEVQNLGIKQGSGNSYYDAAAKRAVKAASPLPPFPKDLKSSYLDLLYKFRIGESTS